MATKSILLVVVGVALFGAGLLIGYLSASTTPTQPTKPLPGQPPGARPIGQGPNIQAMKAHTAYYGTSSDAKTWQKGGLVQKQASVPDVVELTQNLSDFKKGDLLVYFVDFSGFSGPNTENLGLVVSSDGGKTWGSKKIVQVINKPNQGAPVDPSVVQLDDGRLRLYFFGSETTQGDPAQTSGKHKVYSAVSADGVNFTAEPGSRYADERLTDPEVIFFQNKWYMYYSVGQESQLAIADDGLTFTAKPITGGNVGGVPGALVTDDGIRLYGCSKGGIASAIAKDGLNFQPESSNIIDGAMCDPAAIKRLTGDYLMIYKVIESSADQR